MPRRHDDVFAALDDMMRGLGYDYAPPRPTPVVRHYYASLTGAASGTTLDLVQAAVWGLGLSGKNSAHSAGCGSRSNTTRISEWATPSEGQHASPRPMVTYCAGVTGLTMRLLPNGVHSTLCLGLERLTRLGRHRVKLSLCRLEPPLGGSRVLCRHRLGVCQVIVLGRHDWSFPVSERALKMIGRPGADESPDEPRGRAKEDEQP